MDKSEYEKLCRLFLSVKIQMWMLMIRFSWEKIYYPRFILQNEKFHVPFWEKVEVDAYSRSISFFFTFSFYFFIDCHLEWCTNDNIYHLYWLNTIWNSKHTLSEPNLWHTLSLALSFEKLRIQLGPPPNIDINSFIRPMFSNFFFYLIQRMSG